jgi:hypothetical protein
MSYLGDKINTSVETKLIQMFRKEFKFDIFKKLLKECNAVVAGGSVLSASVPKRYQYWSSDIDIYVRIEDCKPLLNFLFGICNHKKFQTGRFANYCETFLSKNGIRCIYRRKGGGETSLYSIDLMTIRNSKTPIDVVKNFDLSFCQVWYDGEKTYAVYPEDMKSMKGFVTGDYIKPLMNNNSFLVKRYKKYTDRCFEILIRPTGEHIINEDTMGDICKFKHLSKELVDKTYPDDKSKKKLISKIILRIINEVKDDSGYDSDEYEDISAFDKFNTEDVKTAIEKYKSAILKGSHKNPHSFFLLKALKLFESI